MASNFQDSSSDTTALDVECTQNKKELFMFWKNIDWEYLNYSISQSLNWTKLTEKEGWRKNL